MLWWFAILFFSTAAVLWAGIAFYLRVRRHIKESTSPQATGKD
jgi:putative exporter of polyketide antibiotics